MNFQLYKLSTHQTIKPLLILITSVILFFSSCIFTEDPVEIILERIDTNLATKGIKTIAFAFDNKIHLIYTYGNKNRTITKDSIFVKDIALSYKGDKIAYRSLNNSVVVIDTLGVPLSNQPVETGIVSFGWSGDDSTLYLFNGDTLIFYGPSIAIPEISFNSKTTNQDIKHLVISRNNDIAYDYISNHSDYGEMYILNVKYSDSTKAVKTYYNLAYKDSPIDNVHWSGKGNGLLFQISSYKYRWLLQYETPDEVGTLQSSAKYHLSFDGKEIAYNINSGGMFNLEYNIYIQNLEESFNSRTITALGTLSKSEMSLDWK